jgi:hypothetical protein
MPTPYREVTHRAGESTGNHVWDDFIEDGTEEAQQASYRPREQGLLAEGLLSHGLCFSSFDEDTSQELEMPVLSTRWNPSRTACVAEGLEVPCCMWPAVSKSRERYDGCSDMPLALCLVAFRYPRPVKKGCLRLD